MTERETEDTEGQMFRPVVEKREPGTDDTEGQISRPRVVKKERDPEGDDAEGA